MDLKRLSDPLSTNDIDFRVQSINKAGYATILAYKDARVDMNRLDEVCGQLNWKREHTRDNANCIVSIWDEQKNQWVSKEDTGTESNTEKEKGLASDSFKRACFNWGIGRELYDYPIIQIKLNNDEFEVKNDKAYATWNLKIREWKWQSEFKDGKIISLSCVDNKGKKRFDIKNYHEHITEKMEDKIEPQPNNEAPKAAYTEIDSCNSHEELVNIMLKYKMFATDKEFSSYCTEKDKKFTKK